MSRERPSYYDGTQFVIYVDLPAGKWTTAELYEHVYGVRLNDGAKPWPYFRHAETREWWSLSTTSSFPLDAIVWMIDLPQLAYKSRDDARRFLRDVLAELGQRAERFGATATPESSASDALQKMDRVSQMLKVRDYQVTIVVAAPKKSPFGVAKWWNALETAGLTLGDGNLFWLYNDDADEDSSEPYELFCAEPYSVPGYFHEGDLDGPIAFPDVAFHFRARDFEEPIPLLRRMNDVAERLAQKTGATLVTIDGQPFRLEVAESELKSALATLQQLPSGISDDDAGAR